MSHAYNAPLHRFAVFTACCTLLLVVAGALVTSNDAGLSVPDWPLSYGSLMPPMVGGVFYEHGHRMIATLVGMLTIGLAVWLQLREPRRWMRRLGWIALAAVILQGLLGGLTVLFYLPRPVSIAHASLAQLFFCTTVSIALFTSRWWVQEAEPQRGAAADEVRRFALATAAVVFLQLALGASFRHHALSILPHALWAFVVLAFSVTLSRKLRLGFPEVEPLRRIAALLAALVGTQILLGLAAWWARLVAAEFPQPIPMMVALTVAHVAVGASALATAVLAVLCCYRLLPPAARAQQAASSGALQGSAS